MVPDSPARELPGQRPPQLLGWRGHRAWEPSKPRKGSPTTTPPEGEAGEVSFQHTWHRVGASSSWSSLKKWRLEIWIWTIQNADVAFSEWTHLYKGWLRHHKSFCMAIMTKKKKQQQQQLAPAEQGWRSWQTVPWWPLLGCKWPNKCTTVPWVFTWFHYWHVTKYPKTHEIYTLKKNKADDVPARHIELHGHQWKGKSKRWRPPADPRWFWHLNITCLARRWHLEVSDHEALYCDT